MIIRTLRFLLSLYAVCLLVQFALPYVTSSQRPWMAVLSRICEPGVRMGNNIAARLLPDRRFKIDVGPLAAVVVCWLARLILGWFI